MQVSLRLHPPLAWPLTSMSLLPSNDCTAGIFQLYFLVHSSLEKGVNSQVPSVVVNGSLKKLGNTEI